jgi:UDPglucose 6-dehydrogenase
VIRKLETIFEGNLQGKTIAIWGLSFKPNTDDVRESPALEIIRHLTRSGANVNAYDPIAIRNFQNMYGENGVNWCSDAMKAASGADALCLLTEWDEFVHVDLNQLQSILRKPILIDGRNVFKEEDLTGTSFIYYSIGRPRLNQGVKEEMTTLYY